MKLQRLQYTETYYRKVSIKLIYLKLILLFLRPLPA